MSDLTKAYEPTAVEEKWYASWLKNNFFTANPHSSKPAYSIVIPPPNVTGILTLGHVLNTTIQDILSRKARMDGKEVLWLPGTDHAGIATQIVVEKKVRNEEKKTRHDFGRDAFISKIWQWKETHGDIIIEQLKKLGCSCDWSRERFTMDEAYSRRVLETFVDLYNKGLIYRGKRIVNWCVVSNTALSDEEVIMRDNKGSLWYFKYPLADGSGFVTVATTRPETMLGDSAVAVNPKDERFTHIIGKKLKLPLTNREIPIIGDDLVDPAFGTGCVKVTPFHDPADFEMGNRHHLDFIQVIGFNGKMTSAAGSNFEKLDRFDARKKVIEELTSLGLVEKIEPYSNNVGYSDRAGVPIEPMVSLQWFLRYPQTNESLAAVTKGTSQKIKFYPERWEKVYEHWLTHIQDWCISRQLWWGHQIPVWYKDQEIKCQIDSPGAGWVQDSDVLDTWFSSWLWPFATMDKETKAKFYPTTDLVTGPDIIFFWVARMIMAGFEYENQEPFKNVYFTGIIRDKQGQKMSKSLGNSPDPLNLIKTYGADGLRFGLIRIAPQGQDIRFDEQQIEGGRNFANKLWNACRFRQMQDLPTQSPDKISAPTADDQWILNRLSKTVTSVNTLLSEYEFSATAQSLFDFFRGDYCDWYVEVAKSQLIDPELKVQTCAVMDYVSSLTLRMLHPYMPFITEELWSIMFSGGETIMFTQFPTQIEDRIQNLIHATKVVGVENRNTSARLGRNLRAQCKVASNKKVKFFLKTKAEMAPTDQASLATLLTAEELVLDTHYDAKKGTPMVLSPLGELYLPLDGLIDIDAEKQRLQKELETVTIEIQKVQTKLENPDFAAKVPVKVLEEHQQRQKSWEQKKTQLQELLANLQS